MNHREWVQRAFNNEEVQRVPMGFWFHFLKNEVDADVFETPEKLDVTLEGHRRFITEFEPDFIKIMCDGFFQYPLQGGKPRMDSLKDLELIQPLDASHPWVTTQAAFARQVADFDRERLALYSCFSPASYLRYKLMKSPYTVADLLKADAQRVSAALNRMAEGIAAMLNAVGEEAKVDGFYLSVGNSDSERIGDEAYRKCITPSDKKVLSAANAAAKNTLMHICGWGGQRNNLAAFKDYEPTVYNWATHVENIGLAEGKRILGDTRAVLGGFPSEERSFLYKGGTREEIQNFARKLVQENGKKGILIGADCTMPMDMSWERLKWVREALKAE